mgnify:CR=1 FL=1
MGLYSIYSFSFAKIKINTLIFGELLGIKETSGSKIVWDYMLVDLMEQFSE